MINIISILSAYHQDIESITIDSLFTKKIKSKRWSKMKTKRRYIFTCLESIIKMTTSKAKKFIGVFSKLKLTQV